MKRSLSERQAEMRERSRASKRAGNSAVESRDLAETATVREAAYRFRCTREQVINLIRRGYLQGYQKCKGGKWYVMAWSLEQYEQKLVEMYRNRGGWPPQRLERPGESPQDGLKRYFRERKQQKLLEAAPQGASVPELIAILEQAGE